ncbi:MAG: hypothetical protein ACOYK6_08045 [Chthoniobacterales bacterium]
MAIFSIAGGQWTLLQTIAYVRMVYSYSSTGTLTSAVEKTFSGKYPCALCKKISMEKKKATKNETALEKSTKKLDLFFASIMRLEAPDVGATSYPSTRDGEYTDPVLEIPERPPAPSSQFPI